MTELITFPDVELLMVQHLDAVLNDAYVCTDVPDPRPAVIVTIQRVGGIRRNLVTDTALMSIQAWAPNKAGSYDLLKLVRAHIHAMPGNQISGSWIYKVVEVGGPIFLPDPESEAPRYQFTVQVWTRGTKI